MLLALVVVAIGSAIITASFSYYFGDWKNQSPLLLFIHFLSWWVPFLVLSILPIDIATTFYKYEWQHFGKIDNSNLTLPFFYVEPGTLIVTWNIIYWTSQFMTWFLLPIMRGYVNAGDFTVIGKLRSALIEHAVYQLSYLILFLAILFYLLFKKAVVLNISCLKILIITTGNTWGLFLVVIFLGFGLIEIPRTLWIASKPTLSLRRAYHQVSRTNSELLDEEEKLAVLTKKINTIGSYISPDHPLHQFYQIIRRQITSNTLVNVHASDTQDEDTFVGTSVTVKHLVGLHKSLKSAQHNCARARALYDDVTQHAIKVEDIIASRRARIHSHFLSSSRNGMVSKTSAHSSIFSILLMKLTYYWCCIIRFKVLRILSVMAIVFSVLTVWSECTFFVRSYDLSFVALLMKSGVSRHGYFSLYVVYFITMGYLSLSVFFTVFRIRLFNYYRLVGNHHTDIGSLLFCGTFLCRLVPSLCLNFLGLAHLDNHIVAPLEDNTSVPVNDGFQTCYTQFMGHLDVIPIIAKGFNIYFPMLVLLLCLMTYFRLGSRLMHNLGWTQLIDLEEDTNSSSHLFEDSIQDGRLLVQKERMVMEMNSRLHSEDAVHQDKLRSFDFMKSRKLESYSTDRIPLLSDTSREMTSIDSRHSRNKINSSPVEYDESALTDEFNFYTQ